MLVRDDGSIAGTIAVAASRLRYGRGTGKSDGKREAPHSDVQPQPGSQVRYGIGIGGTLDIFVEPILPPAIALYIYGAGHVSVNLTKWLEGQASKSSWWTTAKPTPIVNGFPRPRRSLLKIFDRVMAQLNPGEAAYLVIVTRGHRG